jgi:hypothetical protein
MIVNATIKFSWRSARIGPVRCARRAAFACAMVLLAGCGTTRTNEGASPSQSKNVIERTAENGRESGVPARS